MAERAQLAVKKPEVKSGNSAIYRRKSDHSPSLSSTAERILFLQRTIGNQAVQRMVRSGALQAKLSIGQPGDVYEQEADRVADAVMRMPEPEMQRQVEEEEETLQAKPLAEEITPLVQRQVEPEEEEEELQAKTTSGRISEVTPNLESRILSLKGGGQPLAKSEKYFFEPRFGYKFSMVQIHTNTDSDNLNRALNSRAFTNGKDIFFRNGEYLRGSSTSRELLAHELTHVVQQTGELQLSSKTALIQRQGKKEEGEATPAVAEAAKTTPAPDPQKLSGSHWTGIAETHSTSLEDLTDPFKTNAKNFIAAMETAGATVSINTTKRPIQRAWLMHHAWTIANGGSAPTNDPHNTGIIWDHGTPDETKKKAEEMIGPSGFNMAYDASLTSRHLSGNAVDMSISNMPDKWTFKQEEKDVTVDLGSPNTGQNTKLHTAADSYFNVKKLVSDAPHWSDNGH